MNVNDSSATKKKDRLALVIGNSNYKTVGKLRNPKNDANDIERVLTSLNFDVTKVLDTDLDTLQQSINTFLKELDEYSVGLLFYSGHGMQIDGKNYIIPIDLEMCDKSKTMVSCYCIDLFLDGFSSYKDKVFICILDACRNNPFAFSKGLVTGFSPLCNPPEGVIIAYSTSKDSTASDGMGRNGVYTQVLKEEMLIPDLKIEEMFKSVRNKVSDITEKYYGEKQLSWEYSSLVGDFYFSVSPDSAERVASDNTSPQIPAKQSLTEEGIGCERIISSKQENTTRMDTFQNVKIGDAIPFGKYPQGKNGEPAPIEWLVLDVKDRQALLISKQALDAVPYNKKNESTSWAACSLRAWLNKTFIRTAFRADEANRIAVSDLTVEENPEYGTEAGENTQDQVFLLSIQEADDYFLSDNARRCVPTAYAAAQGAYTEGSDENGWWWIRSPGFDRRAAAHVDRSGSVNCLGNYVNNSTLGVRPAMWVKLDY